MVEDSPEDVVYDVLAEAVFGPQSLGQTILGPAEKLEKYTPDDLRAFRQRHYGPKNAVVALAGNVDIQAVKDLMEELREKQVELILHDLSDRVADKVVEKLK